MTEHDPSIGPDDRDETGASAGTPGDAQSADATGHPRDEGSAGGRGHARDAVWDDVAAQFSNLGKQIRSRFDRSARSGSDDPWDADPSSSAGQTSPSRGGDSVRRWIDSLDETFTRIGDTVRDPAFRDQAETSVSRLGTALGATLREFGEQLQDRFEGRAEARSGTESQARSTTTSEPSSEPGEAMPDVPPPPPPAPAPPTSGAIGPADPPPASGANAPVDPPAAATSTDHDDPLADEGPPIT